MTSPRDLSDLDLEFLGIAEGRIYREPVKVHTLLGSCVAVTMHCPMRRMGGIFHGLLPREADFDRERHDGSPYRFVDSGVEALSGAMAGQGADMRTLEAKVFGGAGTLGQEKSGVGLKNVRAALDILDKLGIRVAAVNVGGRNGRKLYFLPHSGEVFLKALQGQPSHLSRSCRFDAF